MKPTTAANDQRQLSEHERLSYTVEESAELLGISVVSVRRLIRRGLIKPSRALRILLISRNELERFLRETSSLAHDEAAKV